MQLVKHGGQSAIIFMLILFGICGMQQAAKADDGIVTPLPIFDRETAIVGGQPASPGEWPWQAFVRASMYMCGGTLIHQGWIVTAAHCVSKQGAVYAATEIQVTLGEHHRYQSEGMEQIFQITQVIVHPGYDSRTHSNDIALLKLAAPATLSAAVQVIQPAVSPEDDALVAAAMPAVTTGWGATAEGGSVSAELMEVTVPIITNAQCNEIYGMITDGMLCAGYEAGGKDACQGDSGGPLVVPTDDQRWKLAGVVSFGYGCARAQFYGAYTRTSAYVAWMEEQIGESITPPPTGAVEISMPVMTPDTLLTGTSTTVLPDQPTTITLSGTKDSEIVIEIPAGAVDTPTELYFNKTKLTMQPTTAHLSQTAMALGAVQNNLVLDSLTFRQALTVTIHYNEEEVKQLGEGELAVFAFDPTTGVWSGSNITLIDYQPEANRIVVAITQLAEYALGVPNRMVFLPLIAR